MSIALVVANLMDKERREKFLSEYNTQHRFVVKADPAAAPVLDGPAGPMPVITTQDAYAKFPVGTPVRDILSGLEGTVAEPPQGDFGDVLFITSKEDGKTYAVRFDQIQAVEGAPGVMPTGAPAPSPELGEMSKPEDAAGGPIAQPAPASLQPKATVADYKERLRARLRAARALEPLKDDLVITSAKDERKLTYGHLKNHLKASAIQTSKVAIDYLGYVPENWDRVFSSLVAELKTVKIIGGDFDIAAMKTQGMTDDEIRTTVCAANGPVLAKINEGLKFIADQPTSPKPPDEPGFTFVWDTVSKNWEKIKASMAPEVAQGAEVKVPSHDPKSPSSTTQTPPVALAGPTPNPEASTAATAEVSQGGELPTKQVPTKMPATAPQPLKKDEPIAAAKNDPEVAEGGALKQEGTPSSPSPSGTPKLETAPSGQVADGKLPAAKGGSEPVSPIGDTITQVATDVAAPTVGKADLPVDKAEGAKVENKVQFGPEKAPKEMKKEAEVSETKPVEQEAAAVSEGEDRKETVKIESSAKRVFAFEGQGSYAGLDLTPVLGASETGWVRPAFEKEEAMKVAAAFGGSFDEKQDSFVFPANEKREAALSFAASKIVAGKEEKTVYLIGTGAWPWDYADEK